MWAARWPGRHQPNDSIFRKVNASPANKDSGNALISLHAQPFILPAWNDWLRQHHEAYDHPGRCVECCRARQDDALTEWSECAESRADANWDLIRTKGLQISV